MMGCRHGAKNTPGQELSLSGGEARRQVFAETKVVDVRPLERHSRWQRRLRSSHREVDRVVFDRQPRRFTCRGVVFSASSLGTMELLFHLKDKGSLPAISDQLGKHVRTNSESLIGVRVPGSSEDLSKGVAIGSGVYIDEHTHIEAVRYPDGSDTMSLLTTILTGGRPGPARIVLWLKNLCVLVAAPSLQDVARSCSPSAGRASASSCCACRRSTVTSTCAGSGHGIWPFRKFLVSRGPTRAHLHSRRPTSSPQKFAQLAGGTAMSMLPEILFDVPGTAHCLGGCVIADSPENGVVDSRHRVFGYKNMYVCDGSVVAANLGVNPSLTITALTERAMSFIPPASETEWNDAADVMPVAAPSPA